MCQPQTVEAGVSPAILTTLCRRGRRRNGRRNSGSESLFPACPMQDENDQPNHERAEPAGNSNKHQPAQHTQRIQKVAVILSVDDARMHRSFIHFAAVGICDPCACHHRSNWRKREEDDEDQNNPVKNPREPFPSRQWWRGRVHCRGCVLLNPSV
jgi:hypothetical protein